MTRLPYDLRVHLGLLALGLAATSLAAQAQSSTPSVLREPLSLAVTPARPEIGSLVLLSIRRSSASGDSIVGITGWMAGEPLHFRGDSTGVERAFGLVPLEASDSVVARVVVRRSSGEIDTLRSALSVPHRESRGWPSRAGATPSRVE